MKKSGSASSYLRSIAVFLAIAVFLTFVHVALARWILGDFVFFVATVGLFAFAIIVGRLIRV